MSESNNEKEAPAKVDAIEEFWKAVGEVEKSHGFKIHGTADLMASSVEGGRVLVEPRIQLHAVPTNTEGQ